LSTANLLEVTWSLIALVGFIAALRCVVLASGDLRHARSGGSSRAVRYTGGQQVRHWVAVAVACLCLLIIGLQSMTLPPVPGRGNNAILSGICLIVICWVVSTLPVEYLINRRKVLRDKE
jgi:uncharacterized BrkB/YihY/UPF0761 family membrane protein